MHLEMYENKSNVIKLWHVDAESLPVWYHSAQFNDDGVNAAYRHLLTEVSAHNGVAYNSRIPLPESKATPLRARIIPPERNNYLRDVSRTLRSYHANVGAKRKLHLHQALTDAAAALPEGNRDLLEQKGSRGTRRFATRMSEPLNGWNALVEKYTQDEYVYTVLGRNPSTNVLTESLSRSKIARVALPKRATVMVIACSFLGKENVPGKFHSRLAFSH